MRVSQADRKFSQMYNTGSYFHILSFTLNTHSIDKNQFYREVSSGSCVSLETGHPKGSGSQFCGGDPQVHALWGWWYAHSWSAHAVQGKVLGLLGLLRNWGSRAQHQCLILQPFRSQCWGMSTWQVCFGDTDLGRI